MKFCPQCHRPEGESCSMESLPGFSCPEPVEEDANTVVITCGPCGWTRGCPTGKLVQGLKGVHTKFPPCKRDNCQAKLLAPQPVEAPAVQQAVDKAAIAKRSSAKGSKP